MFITTTGRRRGAGGRRRCRSRPRAPGDRVLVSGPLGDHGIAILVARARASALETELDERHRAAARARARACSPPAPTRPLHARSDARRARRRAVRDRRAARASALRLDEAALPVRARGARRVRAAAGSIRSTSPARAGSSRSCPAATPRARSPRCARTRSGATPRSSARCVADAPRDGRRSTSRIGGERVVDDARRRAAAADLLTSIGSAMDRGTDRPPDVDEVDVLWITAGLSCDGDTDRDHRRDAAEHRGRRCSARFPGCPRCACTTRCSRTRPATNSSRRSTPRPRASSGPFVLVVEGSIPNESEQATRATGPRSAPIRRPASRSRRATGSTGSRRSAWAVVAVGTCATYGGIHAMAGNPTGVHGPARLPRLGLPLARRASRSCACPGCPVQPDNFMETLLYLLHQAAGLAPMIPLDEALRPTLAVRPDRARGLRSRRLLRAGRLRRARTARRSASSSSAAGVRSCSATSPKRGWIDGVGGCPNVGGICIGCTMPGFPDKFMPFMDEPPGAKMSSAAVLMYGRTVRALRNFTAVLARQGARLARARRRAHERVRRQP